VARILTYKCAEIEFDFYDTERVPVIKSETKYYLTPKRLDEVCDWLGMSNLKKITTTDQMEILIAIGLIGEY